MKGIRRRLLVPEVVQSSAMDCGPAVLKALLEGFRIPASYGRLREACQTDVDGTSIDTLEEIAGLLGLEAEQVMVPVDHVLLDSARALPAVAVVELPGGLSHFVVAWRRAGPLVEVMDPATGRRWPSGRRFLRELLIHEHDVGAEAWREWAASPEFLEPLDERLAALGIQGRRALVDSARADSTWRSLAALDAATRLAERLAGEEGLLRGPMAERLVERLSERAREEAHEREPPSVPAPFWSVRPSVAAEGSLTLRGAVLVRVKGLQPDASALRDGLRDLPDLALALRERETPPFRRLMALLRGEGSAPLALGIAAVAGAVAVGLEALLFNALLDLGRLATGEQRALGVAAVLAFLALLLGSELLGWSGARRLGRHLEGRLRIAFLDKLPRLGARYFGSRLLADMAERAHNASQLRTLPDLALRLVRSAVELVVTAAGIAWLYPGSGASACAAAVTGLAVPLLFQPLLSERDLRARTMAGALSRFYLDGLLGTVAIRAHSAARTIRREHEALLQQWAGASLSLRRAAVLAEGIGLTAGLGLAAVIVVSYALRQGSVGGLLLLVYWALRLPVLANDVATGLAQLPLHRSVLIRLGEPLEAPEPPEAGATAGADETQSLGPSLEARGLWVRSGGHTILEDLSFKVEGGSHVAVVGPSGAGKSTLIGTLLGWHAPSRGSLQVDGVELSSRLKALREQTAWVDPSVHLWNRPLLANLRYGARGPEGDVGRQIAQADLTDLLEALPEGLQTPLGDGGALVAGGEGQRVRFGRALGRPEARLVLLDEPFRGLGSDQRSRLLSLARALWRRATLVCVTHDAAETRDFDYVLVLDGGRVVEMGTPRALAEQAGSRYRAFLEGEVRLRDEVWSAQDWSKWTVDEGRVATAATPGGVT